jgi:predicted transcriptional regulator
MSSPGREKQVSDIAILEAVAVHPDPVVTPSEVADSVDLTRQGINKRLRDLADDDLLVRKEVGARSVIYWLSENGKRRLHEGLA